MKKSINKLGTVDPLKLAVSAVVIVVVMVLLFGLTQKGFGAWNSASGGQLNELTFQACKEKGRFTQDNLMVDFDQDGLPDCCDPCPEIADNDKSGEFVDNDQDHFQAFNPQYTNHRAFGCLGNNGNLTRDKNGMLDVAAYKKAIDSKKEWKDRIETPERDNDNKLTPVYIPSCSDITQQSKKKA